MANDSTTLDAALFIVKAKKSKLDFFYQFSIPESTIKGLIKRGATIGKKRGSNNHTTNNKYSFYCYMKFYYMVESYYFGKGLMFGDSKKDLSSFSFKNNEEGESFRSRLSIYEYLREHLIFVKKFLNIHFDGDKSLLLNHADLVNRSYDFIDTTIDKGSNSNIQILNLSFKEEDLLNILLTDKSYLFFLFYFYQITTYERNNINEI